MTHLTLYELAVSHPDGRRFLLGYTVGRSRSTLFRWTSKHGPALVAICGTDDIRFARRASDGATMGEWTINWTGRTERQAAAGQLPVISDHEKARST